MREFTWSPAEKKVARAAFDNAYQRECGAIERELRAMLQNARGSDVIWDVEEYLRRRRREMSEKYDFRYSVLPLVFAGLYREGWLTDEDLAGLREDKLQFITDVASL